MRITRRAAALLLAPVLAFPAQAAHAAPVEPAAHLSTSTVTVAAATSSKVTFKAPASAYTRAKIALKLRASVRKKKTRVVRLDVRKPGRWAKVATRRTTKTGRLTFTVTAPKNATTRRYRVTVLASGSLPRARAARTVKIRKAPPAAQTPTPKKPDFTASWQRRTLTLGAADQFSASGTVPGPTGRQRKVVLQRKHADNWKTVTRATTDSTGRFALAAPANWLVNLEHRVYVPSTSKARKRFSQATRLVVRPDWSPRGSASDWAPLTVSPRPGKQVRHRWDGCLGPITYRINRAQAPAFVTDAGIQEIVNEVAEATGLQFVHSGSTPVHAFGLAGTTWPADAEMVISWTRPSQTSQRFPSDTVVGLGGAEGYAGRDSRGDVVSIARGHVLIRVGSPYLTPSDEAETWQVLKHEIAHAVGLGHAPNNTRQLMGPVLRADGDRSFGQGDLSGLRRVGLTEGCITPANWGATSLDRTAPAPTTTLVALP